VVTSSAEAWEERKSGVRKASAKMTTPRRRSSKSEREELRVALFDLVADLTIRRDSSASSASV
jgi:hypothetical protein